MVPLHEEVSETEQTFLKKVKCSSNNFSIVCLLGFFISFIVTMMSIQLCQFNDVNFLDQSFIQGQGKSIAVTMGLFLLNFCFWLVTRSNKSCHSLNEQNCFCITKSLLMFESNKQPIVHNWKKIQHVTILASSLIDPSSNDIIAKQLSFIKLFVKANLKILGKQSVLKDETEMMCCLLILHCFFQLPRRTEC